MSDELPSRRARGLAVLGTASDVGKSVLAAALGRLAARRGLAVAPFKAQNMSNNSGVTADGREIGRAQMVQAEACGVPPHADMNPILLKPEDDRRSQVVLLGRPLAALEARDYFARTDTLFPQVAAAYERLAAAHDLVVLEGAGSAAEPNLERFDLVNWRMVEHADARVLLVADVDRGGVFAQVLGTLDLLAPARRERVAGVIVNRFRGDPELFRDGVAFLEERGRVPVLGVVPWYRGPRLEDEDALPPLHERARFAHDAVNVAVVLLPRGSNLTDARALAAEPDVRLRFVARVEELAGADVLIVPGSKNTLADLRSLRERGFADALAAFPGRIVGLCGGYQMLGLEIRDPLGVEGVPAAAEGLGLLPVRTELLPAKTTRRARGRCLVLGLDQEVAGYEIHAGETTAADGRWTAAFRLQRDGDAGPSAIEDGAVSGKTFGTYLHGVFDAPRFRRAFLNACRADKGLAPLPLEVSAAATAGLERAIDAFADHVEAHLDARALSDLLGIW